MCKGVKNKKVINNSIFVKSLFFIAVKHHQYNTQF